MNKNMFLTNYFHLQKSQDFLKFKFHILLSARWLQYGFTKITG